MSLNMLRLQAMKAATVVERYFPPKNANEAYAIVAALNRLNALVKQPQFFTVTRHRGLCGLYAYSRFHLLPCIYRNITIHGHFARVMNTDKKIAIYALMQERFITDFVYDSIWYDSTNYRLMGRSGSQLSVIHDLAPWARNRPKVAT